MKTMLLIAACALFACNKDNSADTTRTTSATTEVPATTADNTKLNERDRKGATLTPGDQNNNKADVEITAQIRKAIVGDSALSTDAKNVKIVTQDGAVVLRGPVESEAEKNAVGSKAAGVAGVKHVENQLDVVSEKRGNQ
jgi:hyperosmotically inducible periplasmic protein